MEYALILLVTLLASPFVLRLASTQNKKAKKNIRDIYLGLVILTGALGLFNFETWQENGRSGFDLAASYPQTFLGLFFVVIFLQAVLLTVNRPRLNTLAVILNFANTFVFFAALITLSNHLGRQVVSLASVATIFLVLIGNVVGLVLVNKDKKLLAKFPYG